MKKIIAWSLLALTAISKAENINNHTFNKNFLNNIVVTTVDTNNDDVSKRYQIQINKTQIEPNSNSNFIAQAAQSKIKIAKELIWRITSNQLPITANDCDNAGIDRCVTEDFYCYKFCLANMTPQILAFDKKTNKLYFMLGTHEIGTGGGRTFLFSANINNKQITLLNTADFGQKGTLSPSGKYLVFHGTSIISVYNTQNHSKFDINESENIYHSKTEMHHYLKFKKWISDTRFSYINVKNLLDRQTNSLTFSNAKEITYDIPEKQILFLKTMTEKEYQKESK